MRELPFVSYKITEGALHIGRDYCSLCIGKRYAYDGLYSLFYYHNTLIDKIIYQFKYNHREEMAHVLGVLLGQKVARMFPDIDVIIPVPLHTLRLLWRGYNQSYVLSCEIARYYDKPVWTGLRRVRYTRSQGFLKKVDRKNNLRNAFKVTKTDMIKGKAILLVDDVFTTGSTISACAQELKRHGAKKIYIATLAVVL